MNAPGDDGTDLAADARAELDALIERHWVSTPGEFRNAIWDAGYRKTDSTDDMVRVSYYDHSCDVLTKYCDEHHRRSARVPRSVLGGGDK